MCVWLCMCFPGLVASDGSIFTVGQLLPNGEARHRPVKCRTVVATTITAGRCISGRSRACLCVNRSLKGVYEANSSLQGITRKHRIPYTGVP